MARRRRSGSRMVRTLPFRAILGLVALYLLLLPAGLLADNRQLQAIETGRSAAGAQRVQVDVESLRLGMADESAGMRAYLLTGRRAFLGDYELGRGEAAA